jgi:hypothetical protein
MVWPSVAGGRGSPQGSSGRGSRQPGLCTSPAACVRLVLVGGALLWGHFIWTTSGTTAAAAARQGPGAVQPAHRGLRSTFTEAYAAGAFIGVVDAATRVPTPTPTPTAGAIPWQADAHPHPAASPDAAAVKGALEAAKPLPSASTAPPSTSKAAGPAPSYDVSGNPALALIFNQPEARPLQLPIVAPGAHPSPIWPLPDPDPVERAVASAAFKAAAAVARQMVDAAAARHKLGSGAAEPLFLVYGSQDSWGSYVSVQFYSLFRTLFHAYGWGAVSAPDDVPQSWKDLHRLLMSVHGRVPDVLLFVEEFHTLAEWGPVPRDLLPGVEM